MTFALIGLLAVLAGLLLFAWRAFAAVRERQAERAFQRMRMIAIVAEHCETDESDGVSLAPVHARANASS